MTNAFLIASVMLAASATPITRPTASPRRVLNVTDVNAHEIFPVYVAVGVPTTIGFEIPIKENGALLADVAGGFYPFQRTEKSIILVPKKDLSKATTTLQVTLADGTTLPFRLLQATGSPDLQVDVVVAVEKQAPPDSAQVLKAFIAQLRAQLDECHATAGDAGLSKVAAMILAQDLSKPHAFTVEHHIIHHLDKQQRLLVDAQHLYRLFGVTYVVLTIQNRDPTRTWVLDHPEVRLDRSDAKVVTCVTEFPTLPPDETEKIVVAFTPPEQAPGARFKLTLVERHGSRHVTLDDLQL